MCTISVPLIQKNGERLREGAKAKRAYTVTEVSPPTNCSDKYLVMRYVQKDQCILTYDVTNRTH